MRNTLHEKIRIKEKSGENRISNSTSEYYDRAQRDYLNKRNISALKNVNKAIMIKMTYYLAHILKGHIHFEMDQDDLSMESYKHASLLRPNRFESYLWIAGIHLVNGNFIEAERLSKKALLLLNKLSRPGKFDLSLVLDTYICSLFEQGKHIRARSIIRKAKEKYRIDLEYLLKRTWGQGQPRKPGTDSKK